MRLLAFISFILLNVNAIVSHKLYFEPFNNLSNKSSEEVIHWVLLVAGSNEWYNYRHQADISHAYQVVRKHGIPAEHIVTMMYDDIAHSRKNPFPGKIFNRPGGPDVYEGVVIDYQSHDVTPENFLAILRGDEKLMAGKGSGKVIKSGPNDHIFVNFVDHGAPGVLVFPEDVLHANDLIKTIKEMHENKKYGQMVLYIEACESGSMFLGLLPENINVYATTAANSEESSYACYYDPKVGTFIGDLYSVNWMEDSDEEYLNLETLHKQFLIVKKETNTSHVCEFGDKKLSQETLDNFQGELNFYVEKQPKTKKERVFKDIVPSEDVPLATLYKNLDYENDEEKRAKIINQIKQLIWEKDYVEETSKAIIAKITSMTNHHFSDLNNGYHQLKSHDCYKEAVKIYKEYCFDITKNGYALKSLRKLVNMCETHVSLDVISMAMKNTCTYASQDVHRYEN